MDKSDSDRASPNQRRRDKGPPKGMTLADYDVGKGKPPPPPPRGPHSRAWEKGGPSPNPKGRPPKPKPGKRDLDHFLDQRVDVPTDRGPETYTKRELGYLAIANHFGKGAPWAIRLVLQHGQARDGGKPIDPLLFDPKLTEEIVHAMEQEIRRGAGNDGVVQDEGDRS